MLGTFNERLIRLILIYTCNVIIQFMIDQKTEVCNTKTTEEIRFSITKAATQNKTAKKCVHCKTWLNSFRYSDNKLIMSVKTGAKTVDKIYLLPIKCREFLRNIYKANAELLNLLYPILDNKLENPFDIFFTECVLVTPPNSRPVRNLYHTILLNHYYNPNKL